MNMLYKTGYIPYAGALGVLVLRVSLSVFLLAGHGFEKWNMLFSGDRVDFPDLFGLCPELTLGLVTFAEVICSILVAIGLLTKWAVIPLICSMFGVVFFIYGEGGDAIRETASLYGIGFAALLFTGPGKFSVDALLKREG